jgi:NAD(P)-dependent dehydrogenase (short-subunit alcohol dehydrogenase family)
LNRAKVVLITGAASGIGMVTAHKFRGAGFRVHVCDADAATVESFSSANPDIGATVTDVADVEAVDRLFDEVAEQYDGLDVLVNNAGIAGPTAAVEDIDPDDWNRAVAVDLNGQFYCTRRAVPLLKKAGGGSIVNIASNAAFFGFPLRSPYTACKWALIGLTRTWAMELGPQGIRVNALCPGSVSGARIDRVIDRDAAERGMTPDQIRDIYARQSSMRLFVSPEDVAAMALFLTSDAGATISGQAIGIDGHTESLSNWLDD